MGWSALCQMVYKEPFPGKSSVVFLPMIDMDPSDMTCIYSTLNCVSKEARRHSSDPVLTFDQPLYWKGRNIIQNEPDDSALKTIVLRLGGFHTEMSFLGSIGNIMNNTGLSELLESVYAPAAVVHMLSGKEISRAIRGHFLVYTALALLMITEIYEIDINILDKIHWDDKENTAHEVDDNQSEHGVNIPDEVNELLHVIDKLLGGSISVTELGENNAVKTLKKRIQAFKDSFGQNRTAKFCIEYMNMIDLLRQFITAERSGHWLLHLKSLQQMLPYLATSGHNLYVKSAHVYLQDMLELEQTHPNLDAAFKSGLHIVRRSDRYWCGLSTDLVIEQALMRSIKSIGGLTRGRGLTETQRAQWLLSMPHCAEMNQAMQITDVNYQTSEQHKEMGKARTEHDHKDTSTFLEFLKERNPFTPGTNLWNIETGVIADGKVDVDRSVEIGSNILRSMEGQQIDDYVFKKNKQVVTLASKTNLKVDGNAYLLIRNYCSNDYCQQQVARFLICLKYSGTNFVITLLLCLNHRECILRTNVGSSTAILNI